MFDFGPFGTDGSSQQEQQDEIPEEKLPKYERELPEDVFSGYHPDFDPTTSKTKVGRELKINDTEGDVWAGEWVRTMFEGGYWDPEQALWIGHDPKETKPKEAPIPHKQQFFHNAVFGQSGNGKTTLLKNMMVQWAYQGHGFCFIDPKGEDLYNLIRALPDHRLDDVIWIDPHIHKYDHLVGFNFLETGDYEDESRVIRERQAIKDDLKSILRNSGNWGASMENVFSTLAGGMMRSEYPFTILHLFYILQDEDFRKKFAESVEDPIIRKQAQKLSEEMDEMGGEAVVRRIQQWVQHDNTRYLISHKESGFDMGNAVKDGKIIIVNAAFQDEDIRKAIASAIMRRIWSAINIREEESDKDPFFLIVDEFRRVYSEESDLQDMLATARSKRMSVTLCTQYPDQLPKSVFSDILGGCQNFLTFNPGEPDDARAIMKKFGNRSAQELQDLGQYRMFYRPTVNNEKRDPVVLNSFAPYPPLRSREEAEEVIQKSIERYGTPIEEIEETVTQDPEELMPDWGDEFNIDENAVQGEDDAVDDGRSQRPDEEKLLEAAYAASIQETDYSDDFNKDLAYVDADRVKEELDVRFEATFDERKAANVIETLMGEYLEHQRIGDEVRIRPTRQGINRVLSFDTGENRTGGSDIHRMILRDAFKTFTRAGYVTTLPSQEGEEQPDGLAKSPIDLEASSVKELQKQLERLEEQYPDVMEISDGADVNIEAETTTYENNAHMMHNLSKAINNDNVGVLAVKDASYESDSASMEKHGVHILKTLKNPEFVKRKDGGKTWFYSFRDTLKVGETEEGWDIVAIRDSDTRATQWVELEDGTMELRDLHNPSKTLFEAEDRGKLFDLDEEDVEKRYYYDKSNRRYEVFIGHGEDEQNYTYQDFEKFKEDYRMIKVPFVPERKFDRLPDDDDWAIIVYPDDDKDLPVLEIKYDGIDPKTEEIQYHLEPLLQADREGWDGLNEYETITWHLRGDPNDPASEDHLIDPDTIEDGFAEGKGTCRTLCDKLVPTSGTTSTDTPTTNDRLCSDCRDKHDELVDES